MEAIVLIHARATFLSRPHTPLGITGARSEAGRVRVDALVKRYRKYCHDKIDLPKWWRFKMNPWLFITWQECGAIRAARSQPTFTIY